MSPLRLSLLFILPLLATATTDVHDLLPTYGLPKGLLPNSVTSYSLSNSGFFEIHLASPCYVQFPTNLVYYSTKITGKLSYGEISDLEGIQAKKLFVWVSISGMKVIPDREVVEFDVGFLSEELGLEEFEEVRGCRGKVGGCRGMARPALDFVPVAQE